MPNAWDIGDTTLKNQLGAWINILITAAETLRVRLYKNDYTPVPNLVIAAFTQADYPGYAMRTFNTNSFPTVGTPVANVASSKSTTVNVFTASSSGFVSQTIYGYYVTDASDNYIYSERFTVPHVVTPSYVINLQIQFKHQCLPVP